MRRLLILSLLVACHSSPPATQTTQPSTEQVMRARCCAECAQASSRDPAGMDIRGKTCTSYPAEWNGGPGIDDACRGWLVAQSQPVLVGDCWKVPDGGAQ